MDFIITTGATLPATIAVIVILIGSIYASALASSQWSNNQIEKKKSKDFAPATTAMLSRLR
jgi:hypothetical protein